MDTTTIDTATTDTATIDTTTTEDGEIRNLIKYLTNYRQGRSSGSARVSQADPNFPQSDPKFVAEIILYILIFKK